jgi:hypothetical protein
MVKEVGLAHGSNTHDGKLPSKTRFGAGHEVKAGASAHGKKLRNRQARRRIRRWNKNAI